MNPECVMLFMADDSLPRTRGDEPCEERRLTAASKAAAQKRRWTRVGQAQSTGQNAVRRTAGMHPAAKVFGLRHDTSPRARGDGSKNGWTTEIRREATPRPGARTNRPLTRRGCCIR